MDTVSYTRMADMTEQDAWLLEQDTQELLRTYPARLLQAVAALGDFQGPLQVTRLEHSLQTATRAHRDGRPDEYVAACLIHDIGDELAPYSHGQMVAAILKPYVSDRVCWMIEKHGSSSRTTTRISSASTGSAARSTATTRTTRTAWTSASCTTRSRSIRRTTRSTSSSSLRR